jgi:hypothetical protein
MKYEVTEVNPPRQAWIVTRARTLNGLPPLECEIVQNVSSEGPVSSRRIYSVVVQTGNRRRALTLREVATERRVAEHTMNGILAHEENVLVTRQTNASLTATAAKNTIARAAKRLDDARQKLAASTAEAPAPQPPQAAAASTLSAGASGGGIVHGRATTGY